MKSTAQKVASLIGLVAVMSVLAIVAIAATTNTTTGDFGHKFIAKQNGQGSILTSFTFSTDIQVTALYLHTSVEGGIDVFVLSRDSATSTSYDFKHLSQDMSSSQDLTWPTNSGVFRLEAEDHFDITGTALISTATWGLEIHYERI